MTGKKKKKPCILTKSQPYSQGSETALSTASGFKLPRKAVTLSAWTSESSGRLARSWGGWSMWGEAERAGFAWPPEKIQLFGQGYGEDGARLPWNCVAMGWEPTDVFWKDGKLLLDRRTNNFSMKAGKYWKKFCIEVVDCPSWEVFRSRLDVALNNLLGAGGWTRGPLEVLSNLGYSMIARINEWLAGERAKV